jgi:ankyrin repeat protein
LREEKFIKIYSKSKSGKAMSEFINHKLFTAIKKTDIEQVKKLITSGVDINHEDENGQTALTLASSIGNSEIISLLIATGAKVNLEPKPLVLDPTIHATKIARGQDLGVLIDQATAESPEKVKDFYTGFMSIINNLSGKPDDSSDNVTTVIPNDDFIEDHRDEQKNHEDYEESANTPIEVAILKGDIDTVRALLHGGANPKPSIWHETPVLVIAVHKGKIEIVQELIAAGSDVNQGFDRLPLHVASEDGHLEVVRLLLDAGAEIEGYEEDYWTALMAAAEAGHLQIVQLLVEKGANVNAWSQGETSLMLAARNVHRTIYDFLYPLVSDDIREIGDRDAEKEMAKTIRRRTREKNKAGESLKDAAMFGNLNEVQQLIAMGADVNAVTACNRTAISLAIQMGKIPVISALLDAGANPNLSDETDDGLDANSPLMEAASTFFATNRGEMVRLLIKRGANLNQQDADGRTPLMHALRYSDMDVIEILIKAGADLDIRDKEGNTALMMAELNQSSKVVNILKQSGASLHGLKEIELLQAVDSGDIDGVRKLLRNNNININIRLGNSTLLYRAAQNGHSEITKLLINTGADINQRSSEGYFNPLLIAAYYGNLEVVKILLEAGADVHIRVQDYLNSLEYAERGKIEGHKHNQGKPYDEVIAILEQYGATRSY